MQRSQKMREGPVRDVRPLSARHNIGEPKVDAFVDASVHNIVRGVREARVCSRIHREPGNGTQNREVHLVGSEEIRKRCRGCSGRVVRPGRVIGIVWCHDERRPGGVASRLEVPILFAVANCRNGPPEIPVSLRVPRGNGSVGYRHVEQGKQSGSVTDVALSTTFVPVVVRSNQRRSRESVRRKPWGLATRDRVGSRGGL